MQSLYDATTAVVSTTGLELTYGQAKILKGIDLSLPRGQTLALLGPSGCGKTTLLRLVAGLLAPTAGRIAVDGKIVADAGLNLFSPPEKRGLGMVFQDYALWPHMTVAGNVSFPLEMLGMSRADRKRRVDAALARVGLEGFGDRGPADMSGGQQQRVAIARAIVAEPQIVLFDEPLSNLDRELRETMVAEIAQLVASLNLTAIYVTHDQSEAFSLAHQVAIMRDGLIEQIAPPEELVGQPASPAVAEFLRLGCVVPVEQDQGRYRIAGADIGFDYHPAGSGVATHMLLPSRAVQAVAPEAGSFTADVARTQFRGDGYLTTVQIASTGPLPELTFLSPARRVVGERIGIAVDTQQIRWFSRSEP